MNEHPRLTTVARLFGTWLERFLAAGIVAGIIAYGISSATELVRMNWLDTATFYELIYRVLLMVIGIELVRTLLTHSLEAILELLAFVVARKTFKADVDALDIFCVHWLSLRCWLPATISCARGREFFSGANHPSENWSSCLPPVHCSPRCRKWGR